MCILILRKIPHNTTDIERRICLKKIRKITAGVLAGMVALSSLATVYAETTSSETASGANFIEREIKADPKYDAVKLAGDVNHDGKVDYLDIIRFYKFLNNEELRQDMSKITNTAARNYLQSKYLENISISLDDCNFDGVGSVDADDVYYFINQFNIHDDVLGDVDMDGVITENDAHFVSAFLLGQSTVKIDNKDIKNPLFYKHGSEINKTAVKSTLLADINSDGFVTIADANYIYNLSIGNKSYSDPNISWITDDLIRQDKEIRSKYDIYAMYNKFGKTDIKFDDVIRDRPYFFTVVHATEEKCQLLNVDRFGNVCRLDDDGHSRLVGFVDNRDVRISPTYPAGHKFTGYAARAVDRLGVWESLRKYCMGTSNVLFLFMDCRPLNISDMSFGASETGAAGAKKAIFMPNATDTNMNSEGLMFPTKLLANDSIEYAVFPKNVKGLSSMACNIKPYEGTVDDPNNSYYYDDDAKGINVKHFSDIFAPEVVGIYAKQNWPKLKDLVLPARIKNIGQGAFQCLNSFSLEKSSFTGNKEKEYEIVFLSQEHVKLNDDKYVWGDIPPVEVWPIIDVYDENWNETYRVRGASANVNVFCFESSGVGKFFNYYFKSGPGNYLITYPCSDKYGYVPIYL